MTHHAPLFGDAPVFRYTRADALADGVLVDVSYLAAEAGFVVPVAVTAAVWSDCVAWSEQDPRRQLPQDQHGRLWDLLSMAHWTVRWTPNPPNPLFFDLRRVPRDGRTLLPELITLKLVIGPGDGGEPVNTVLLPLED